jgi:sec-independent protein translocase protein TatA
VIGSLGWEELLVILAIVALIAGGSRVADLGGSLGRGVREFRQALQEDAPDDEPDPSGAGDEADREAAAEEPPAETAGGAPDDPAQIQADR